jgi:alpha-tubulin suppressor-like RCC1 family protein
VPVGVSVVSLGGASHNSHNCVVTEAGGVRCWGNNEFGQLGYGNVDWYGDDPGETPDVLGDVSLF